MLAISSAAPVSKLKSQMPCPASSAGALSATSVANRPCVKAMCRPHSAAPARDRPRPVHRRAPGQPAPGPTVRCPTIGDGRRYRQARPAGYAPAAYTMFMITSTSGTHIAGKPAVPRPQHQERLAESGQRKYDGDRDHQPVVAAQTRQLLGGAREIAPPAASLQARDRARRTGSEAVKETPATRRSRKPDGIDSRWPT